MLQFPVALAAADTQEIKLLLVPGVPFRSSIKTKFLFTAYMYPDGLFTSMLVSHSFKFFVH